MVLKDFQERKETERLVFSRLVLAILFLLTLLALWGVTVVLKRELAIKREIGLLESKLEDAEERRKALEARLGELTTSAGLEKEARGRFNLKKPGEEVVLFLDDASAMHSGENWARLASIKEFIKYFFSFIWLK